MKRVTGIGGIFFKARDAVALGAWYKKHLGIDVQDWGGTAFRWTNKAGHAKAASVDGWNPSAFTLNCHQGKLEPAPRT